MAAKLVLILGPTGQSVSSISADYRPLNEEQTAIADEIVAGFHGRSSTRHFVLHAEPGCGKTNVTRYLAANAFGEGTEFAACTAAMWVRAKVGQPVADLISSTHCNKSIADPKNIAAIILEEYSMLEGALLSAIHQRMGGGTKPFGGRPVLFTGDLFQLPVVNGDSCLSTAVFRSLAPRVLTLTQQVRLDAESEQEYLACVSEVKNGVVNRRAIVQHADTLDYGISVGGGFRRVPSPTAAQFLCCTRERALAVNLSALKQLAEEDPAAERYAIKAPQPSHPVATAGTPRPTLLVTGCKAMVTANVYNGHRCVAHNGELGIFEGIVGGDKVGYITEGGVTYTEYKLTKNLMFKFRPIDGGAPASRAFGSSDRDEEDTSHPQSPSGFARAECPESPESSPNPNHTDPASGIKLLSPIRLHGGVDGDKKKKTLHVPLEPAHAITVHKSQGQTIHGRVHFDSEGLGGMLASSPGLLYVAMTRVTHGRNFTSNLTSYMLNAIIRDLPPLLPEHRAGVAFARTGCL